MKLLILLYLAEFITNIDNAASAFERFILTYFFIAAIFAVVYLAFLNIFNGDEEDKEVKEKMGFAIEIVKKSIKPLLIILVALILFRAILPSKDFVYMAGGIYMGSEILENPKVNALFEKSYKIIDSKLDEMLQNIGGEK